ncbi:GNAT family N-acetyltransferase [Eisenibacter elegans]|uniref:GNAT family N-acetyltransferase n=1 Tax=Eisenibacter elegans TaxID=997 RepID=UPI00047B1E8D|nr:GNAT family N-acetyltransferase [Eisenibacter elegans]
MQVLNLTTASAQDWARIQALAHATWPDTFGNILTQEQIAYMLDWMYSQSSLLEQMQRGDVFLIAHDAAQDLGFAGYALHTPEAGYCKLHKLYIHPQAQGRGLGRKLLDEVVAATRKAALHTLSLNVNRYNQAAIAFYQHYGFRIAKEENIDIGQGFWMEDFVMEMDM